MVTTLDLLRACARPEASREPDDVGARPGNGGTASSEHAQEQRPASWGRPALVAAALRRADFKA